MKLCCVEQTNTIKCQLPQYNNLLNKIKKHDSAPPPDQCKSQCRTRPSALRAGTTAACAHTRGKAPRPAQLPQASNCSWKCTQSKQRKTKERNYLATGLALRRCGTSARNCRMALSGPPFKTASLLSEPTSSNPAGCALGSRYGRVNGSSDVTAQKRQEISSRVAEKSASNWVFPKRRLLAMSFGRTCPVRTI